MGHQFDFGNVEAGGIIEGLGNGLDQAAKNLYNIKMAQVGVDQKQQELDADTEYKHAAANKMEAEGSISSLEAENMRDYINSQKKAGDAQLDLQGTMIDNVQDRIHKAAMSYNGYLKQAIATPEGQQYMQKRTLGQGALPGQDGQPDPNNPVSGQGNTQNANNPVTGQDKTSSSVVNNIMPGVGSQESQYNDSNLPPMSMVGGGTNMQPAQPQQQQQPSVQSPHQVQSNVQVNTQQPVQNQQQSQVQQQVQNSGSVDSNGQSLPPLNQVYSGLSKAPFGTNTNDLYMKNPNVMEAIKSGQYMVKKEPAMIESANPLSLNENDLTVLNDVTDLKKAGYQSNEIFQQLTPGTQSLINTVGQYRATPAELTSSFGGGRQKQELVKAVQSFYPNWSDAVYDQRHKALIDFTDPNGANGKAIVSLRQGVEHMGELTQSIDAVSNKTMPGTFGRQIPVLNAPLNAIQQYVGGDPDILALKQNINAVSEEMTKAWGGSQAGEGRLKAWRDTMSATNSPQGWSGLLSKTAKLWQAAADTRESMFGMAMGGQKMQDILGEGVLQPEQQSILDRVKSGYSPNQSNNSNNSSNNNLPFSANAYEAEMRKRGLIK